MKPEVVKDIKTSGSVKPIVKLISLEDYLSELETLYHLGTSVAPPSIFGQVVSLHPNQNLHKLVPVVSEVRTVFLTLLTG